MLAGLLVLLLYLSSFAQTVFAQPALEPDAAVSLTLQYKKNGKAIEGANFRMYRAAAVSEELRFTPEGAFAGYGVDWAPKDSAAWKSLAETLSGYVKRDKLTPVREGKTDKDGVLIFSGDDLKPGLYLVIGDRRSIGRYTYIPEPFLVSLPSYGENNTWDYTPTVLPKSSSSYSPPGGGGEDPDPGPISRRAMKVWSDGDSASRPKEVTLQLLRDGEVYAEAKLNDANNWTYSWSGLERGHTWEIVEKEVPEGYYVSTRLEGVTQVITNTKGEQPPMPGDPGEPGEPGEPPVPEEGVEVGVPPTPMTGKPPEPKKSRGKLPQTGVLWYPVPLLASAGLILFGIGWYQERKKKD